MPTQLQLLYHDRPPANSREWRQSTKSEATTGGTRGSAGTNTAARAAPLLSRRAATDRSHGRQPVGRCRLELSPRGAKDSREICRPSGAHRHMAENPRAYAPGHDLSPLRGSNRMRFARHPGQFIHTLYDRVYSSRAATLLVLLITFSLPAAAASSPTALDLYQQA